MIKQISCLLVTVIAMIIAQTAFADTHYVSLAGGNIPPYTSWASAATNIQDAITNALTTTGDTVLVSNGVYQTGGTTNYPAGSLLTNRVVITKAITVRSLNNDPANTIIKGEWDPLTINGPAAVRCVYIEKLAATLIGFTLTNGATVGTDAGVYHDLMGGGVYAEYHKAGGPQVISNCWITGNSCLGGMGLEGAGGGAAKGAYFNCRIIGNSTPYYGGGVSHSKVVSNCFIAFNTTLNTAGGASQSTLYNCQVISNTTFGFYAGGVYKCTMYNCVLAYNGGASANGAAITYTPLARNCLIYGNAGAGGRGVAYLGNGNKLESCTIVGNGYGIRQKTSGSAEITNIILNCIIYSNQTANWEERGPNSKFMFTNTCTYPVNAGWDASNTTNNPRLVDFGAGYGTDHIAGNYRLQANSPCVNRGLNQDWMTNAVDMDGRKRIRYGTADMGAYELIYDGTIYKCH